MTLHTRRCREFFFQEMSKKALYIPNKLFLQGGVANQNNFATPPDLKYEAKITCQNKFATLPHDLRSPIGQGSLFEKLFFSF